MVAEALAVLNSLEHVDGRQRNERIQILQAARDNHVLKNIFQLALDFRISFGVSLTEELTTTIQTADNEKNWTDFSNLVTQLIQRKLVGQAARSRLREFLLQCSTLECKFYQRVIARDLRIGVSIGLVAKVWPDIAVEFGVAQAEAFNGHSIKYPVWVEPYYPGLRAAFILKDSCVTPHSEGFRPFPFLEFIGRDFAAHTTNSVIDGVVSSASFADTASLLNSKIKSLQSAEVLELEQSLVFHALDVCSLSIFDSATEFTDPTSFQARRLRLEKLVTEVLRTNPRSPVRLAESIISRNRTDLLNARESLKAKGFRDIIVKTNGPYQNWQHDGIIVIKEDISANAL